MRTINYIRESRAISKCSKNVAATERGIALFLTIFALLLLTGITAAMLFSSNSETLISVNYRDKQVASYAAMSGLQEARDRLHPEFGDLVQSGYAPTATPGAVPGAGGQVLYIINPNAANGETVANIAPWLATVGGKPNPYFDQELCQENMLGLAGTRGVACGAGAIPAGGCASVTAGGGGWCAFYDNSANPSSFNIPNPLDYKWVRITLKEDWNTPMYVPNAASANGSQVCWDGNYQSQIPAGYTTKCQATAGNAVIGLNITSPGSGFTAAPTVTLSGGGGSGATATATIGPSSVGITGASISAGGSGYTTPPTVSVLNPDGSGATFQASISGSPITSVSVNNSNKNYCYGTSQTPTIAFSTIPVTNTITNATATVNMNSSAGCISSVTQTPSGTCSKYAGTSQTIGSSSPPGGGSGFSGTVSIGSGGNITGITINNVGSGYTSGSHAITIGSGKNACTITPTFSIGKQIQSISIAAGQGGSYMSQPTATLGSATPAAPTSPTLAGVTANWSSAGSAVQSINVLTPGTGYLKPSYTLVFTGGGGSGTAGTAITSSTNIITALNLTSGGSGYTSPPTVAISGGGGTGGSGTATIAAGGINSSMGAIYLLTSLAMTRTGSKSMAQMEVGVRPPFNFNLGGAITLAGPFVLGGPQPVFPNSNNFTVSGNDANSCGGTASAAKPAIGTFDNNSQQTVINDLGKPQNYTGAGGTPSVENVYTAIGGAGATPAALDGFVQSLLPYATNSYSGSVTTLPTTTTSSITYIDGNLTLSGNPSGSGILVITGTLTFSGNFTWNGLVLVIGQGQVIHNGGGNGDFNGAIYVANTQDASGNELSTLGTPQYIWNGGGTNQIQYDHCKSDALLQKYNGQPSPWPLQVLSTRSLQF